MAKKKGMSKTTFAGLCIGVPAAMFFILFLIGKMSETGFIAGLGVLGTIGPVVQGIVSKDEDGVDYKSEIAELRQMIEELKNKS